MELGIPFMQQGFDSPSFNANQVTLIMPNGAEQTVAYDPARQELPFTLHGSALVLTAQGNR